MEGDIWVLELARASKRSVGEGCKMKLHVLTLLSTRSRGLYNLLEATHILESVTTQIESNTILPHHAAKG